MEDVKLCYTIKQLRILISHSQTITLIPPMFRIDFAVLALRMLDALGILFSSLHTIKIAEL